MRTLAQYFQEYSGYHRTHGNEVCHWVGIPLILVCTLGLFSDFALTEGTFRIDGGTILWAAATAWYLVLNWRLGLSFSLVALGGYFLGRAMPGSVLWTLFVVGWIFQGIGHAVYEKNSPAFLKNLEHILIGPLWVFARFIRYI